jgi:flagellar biosynthesis/type III secretory pathway protein FliH
LSDRHTGIYVGESEAKSFVSTLKTADFFLPPKKDQGQSVFEQVEEAKRLAAARGHAEGFEQGHASGLQLGFEEGRTRGFEQAKREGDEARAVELKRFTADLNAMTDRLQGAVAQWFVSSEERMAELTIKAVKKLLAAELEISRDSAIEIVKEALREVTHSRHVRIRVNPFDSATLRDHRQELLSAAENLRDVEIVSDPAITGGCMVESDGGVVDATLDTRLSLLEDRLGRAA